MIYRIRNLKKQIRAKKTKSPRRKLEVRKKRTTNPRDSKNKSIKATRGNPTDSLKNRQEILVEGRNSIIEMLKSKTWIEKVIIQEDINIDEKINEILKRASNRGVFIMRKPKKYLDKISQTGVHQGCIAKARFQYSNFEELIIENDRHKSTNNYIYIRESQYEHNVGAIARSAEAGGFNGILIQPKDRITPSMFRTSMGSLSNIKVCQTSLFSAIKTAKQNNLIVIGIERGETAVNNFELDLSGPCLFIIGGEDRSLSEQITSKCDHIAKIPMVGKINSLNMSVAAAIVIFEKLRQEMNLGV